MLLLWISNDLFHFIHRCLRLILVVIVVGNLYQAFCSDFPCGTGWRYSKRSGKCYRFSSTAKTWAEAKATCEAYTTPEARPGKTSLTMFRTQDDIDGLKDVVVANWEHQWTIGYFDFGGFRMMWNSTLSVNMSIFTLVDNGPTGSNRVVIRYEDRHVNGKWVFTVSLALRLETDKYAFFCEYKAKSCGEPGGGSSVINTLTMQFVPDRFTVATHVHMACRPGFYRTSALASHNITANNLLNCTGTAASNFDPEAFVPEWNMPGLPENCQSVRCATFVHTIPNVLQQPSFAGSDAHGTYAYNHKLHVNCSRGHVSWKDPTKTHSYLQCSQSTRYINQGQWVPSDYQPCVGLRCNMTEMMERKPVHGRISRAINRITRKIYSAYERHSYNLFDNVVVIACNDGFFFKDRSYEKAIICDILDEQMPTIGVWKGYQGTTYPTPNNCEPVICRHEDVIIESEQYLRPFFHIITVTGEIKNQTDHNGKDYNYLTKIRFFCDEGYETANQKTDQNVTCGPKGLWEPRLTPCIAKTQTINLGQRKQYQPPAQEASAAQEIGATVIIIMVIFFVLIVILDLTTITRDVKIMRKNIRYLKDRMNAVPAK